VIIISFATSVFLWALGYHVWGRHVNKKFGSYAAKWRNAKREWNEAKRRGDLPAQRKAYAEQMYWYRAEMRAHRDMCKFSPLHWYRSWNIDYTPGKSELSI
jgi:hypothetical protein